MTKAHVAGFLSMKKIPSLRHQTLEDTFSPHANSLTIVRWLFAALVVVSHSFPLGGYHGGGDPTSTFFKGQTDLGSISVAGFFVLSGFLICRSYLSSNRLGLYLWRRIIRIMPAFWMALLLVAFVLAPLAWLHEHHSIHGYFSAGPASPWHYISANFFVSIYQWNISDLLHATPFATTGHVMAWNGSLWTLRFEFICYDLLGIAGFVGVLRYRSLIVVATLFFYGVAVLHVLDPSYGTNVMPIFFSNDLASLPFLFFLGALFTLYQEKVILDDRLGIAAVLLTIATLHEGGWTIIGLPVFAYALIWFVCRVRFSQFERIGDPSYGTYVYAFPIQMFLAEFGYSNLGHWSGRGGALAYITTSVALASLAGLLSWHLLEKHALTLKQGVPGVTALKRHFTRNPTPE